MAYDSRGVVTTVVSARTVAGATEAAGRDAPRTALPESAGRATGAGGTTPGCVVSARTAAVSTAGRRGDGKSMGVATMTIAVSSSARRVRRSIQDVATEPGRNRPVGRGDSAECGAR